MKLKLLSYLFLCFLLFKAPLVTYSQSLPSITPRLLQLKIKEKDEAKVQVSRLSVASDSSVSIGIQRLDVLSKQFGVSKMRRVFPHAGEFEEKHRRYGLHLWYVLELDEDVDPQLAANFYKATGEVEQAEPVYRVVRIDGLSQKSQDATDGLRSSGISQNAVTNDPNLPKQWHYHNDGSVAGSIAGVDVKLFDAWDIIMGSSDIVVAVIDGGIDYTHEDLAANMWKNKLEIPGNGVDDDNNGYKDDVYGFNFYGGSGNITADNHGTHVAGTVSAVSNNSKGVAGVAGGSGGGNGVRLMSCQIFEANGNGTASSLDIKRAFVYAADNGAIICQNSWGYDNPNSHAPTDLDAIRYFINEAGRDANGNPRPNTPMVGGIVIFAAGNYSSSAKYYPQAFPEVTSVAAVGPDGKKARYSNYGDWVDISAPGGHYPASQEQQIFSTYPTSTYGYDAGTSMACPHVSGVAALILATYGHEAYTPDSLRYRLLQSARSLKDLEPNYASQLGVGLLDASRALRWVPVESIELNQANIRLFDKQKAQLLATVVPANASSKEVEWTSSNSQCVSVDKQGNIEAFSNGGSSAVITARTADGGFEARCNVVVYKDILVPEGFSPNGDGINDYLEMILVEGEKYALRVFDRSGQPYYESRDYQNRWDGIANVGPSNGKKVPSGTYFYVLTNSKDGLSKRGYFIIKY